MITMIMMTGVGHTGEVLTRYCKCGHSKNLHQPMPDGTIQCQVKMFHEGAQKMMQCGCKIGYDDGRM